MAGRIAIGIVDYLKENNSTALVDISEFARRMGVSVSGVAFTLHELLDKNVIKRLLDGDESLSTKYVLIGELPAEAQKPSRRVNRNFSGDLLKRAMEQVATLKTTQDQLLVALQRNKELEKMVQQLEKQVADQKEELQSTDTQLLNEQEKFFDLLKSVENNNKKITKQTLFDGRGFQRTV